jgi:hypothetical protein
MSSLIVAQLAYRVGLRSSVLMVGSAERTLKRIGRKGVCNTDWMDAVGELARRYGSSERSVYLY